jgi:hypothetical protein
MGMFIANGFSQKADTDSIKFRISDIFPAFSYSPEPKFSLGALGYLYLDLKKEDPETVQSYINFLTRLTSNNQVLGEINRELLTDGNKLRFLGGMEYA